jgi:hypothetical protein
MSQHHFSTDVFHIMAGWDSPLQHYFLNVQAIHAAPDEWVYDNLSDPDLPLGGGMTLADVKARLAALQVTPPSRLYENLEQDRVHDVGSIVVHYRELRES